MSQVPCQNCGATDWIVTMFTDCDKCNPDLSVERMMKQDECPHKNQIPSRIIGLSKCEDCGMVGTELFAKPDPFCQHCTCPVCRDTRQCEKCGEKMKY